MIPMPDRLERALTSAGEEVDDVFEVLPLSGTGNFSYLVGFRDRKIVVRLDNGETSGVVDRELELAHAGLVAELGLAPEVLYGESESGLLITHYVDGTRLDQLPRPYSDRLLHDLAKAVSALQRCKGFAGEMDPWQKIDLYLDMAGIADPAHESAFGALWYSLSALRVRTQLDRDQLVPCHVDPVPENILDTADGVILLDWEYAALSHQMWDVAYFASEASLTRQECNILIQAMETSGALGDLACWICVAQAVSLAWCLAREQRAVDDRIDWGQVVVERRSRLQHALNDAEH